jgi:hypothetical protein
MAVVRADGREECIASIIRVKRVSELGTDFFTKIIEVVRFSETYVLNTVIRRHIPEDGFFIVTDRKPQILRNITRLGCVAKT